MKVAFVHYWLVGMRGGEKVIESLCDLYPSADIFTLVADHEKLSEKILRHKITTSFLQRIGGRKHYQKMLPLMPFALESFDLTGYDLVISSEAGPAKGIVTRPDAVHVCYCHSPMRYIWDQYSSYRNNVGAISKVAMSLTAPMLRQWDVTTAARVDHFIANSGYVAKRIEKYYRRQSDVINPPVDVVRFAISESVGDYYLCAGQITPYKKIEIAVEACTKLNRKLVVVGNGAPPALKKIAGSSVSFVEEATDKEMAKYFAECRALIYPGLEDFGIVPLEVMASGRPVIAFGKGGACETVIDGQTGILFKDQSSECLIEAIEAFERRETAFQAVECQRHAATFDVSSFKEKLSRKIEKILVG